MLCLIGLHRWKPKCSQFTIWADPWGLSALYSMRSALRSIGHDPGPMPNLFKIGWAPSGKVCTRCGLRKHKKVTP